MVFQIKSISIFFFVSVLIFTFLQLYLLTITTRAPSNLISSRSAPLIPAFTELSSARSEETNIYPSFSPSSTSSSSHLNTTSHLPALRNTSFVLRSSGLTDIPSLWKTYEGSTWPDGFCRGFLGTTYEHKFKVCSDRITCYGTAHSKKMGTCTLQRVGIDPTALYNVMTTLKVEKILDSNSVWLLGKRECPNPSFRDMETHMEKFDPIVPMVKMSTLVSNRGKSCQLYINGTTLLYVGMAKHIYFRFLSWYNLYRSLRQHSEEKNNLHIIRMPEIEGQFMFPEFERKLFGEVIPLENLTSYENVCFETLELVSWAYGAPMFRCKMDGAAMKKRCLTCSGAGLSTDLTSFREHIITGCSLKDDDTSNREGSKTKKITIIERKRYERYKGDPVKKFRRIWTNSEDLINKLRETFPQASVTGLYAEALPICEQIRIMHKTDVMIAMHGAGMVHLWWLQKRGVILELVPKSQRGNAAFITLAKHLGRTHKIINSVKEKGAIVTVDINKIVSEVKKFI